MRSNSGKDESRNNLHDPTLREHGTRQGALKSHAKFAGLLIRECKG